MLKIRAACTKVAEAVRCSAWEEVQHSLVEMLWCVAELRPDFEDLPKWIAGGMDNGSSAALREKRVTSAPEKVYAILNRVVERYGDDADRATASKMKAGLFTFRDTVPPGQMATFCTELGLWVLKLRNGVRRLPLAISMNELLIGRHTRLSFNRTLRIPEDGRKYSLPAGLGRLPILQVEDYANRVPERWLEQGGFFIPLYQREALFLEFTGVQWRPTIAKVSVGRVNALSGKEHDLEIRPHRQDYVVIPEQRWLDGINTGNGSVSQFVAMPLGKGYTIEAQVTDEERFGGFQVAVFDPRTGRFPEHNPKEQNESIAARKQRSLRAAQKELLDALPPAQKRVIVEVQRMQYQSAGISLCQSDLEVLRVIMQVRLHFERVLGKNGFEGVIPAEHLEARKVTPDVHFMPSKRRKDDAHFSRRGEMAKEMGIAKGGMIEQQIIQDTYGAESWDEFAFRDIVIRIVNSEVYKRITGLEAPPSPITEQEYRNQKIPWYSDYKEKAPTLSPVAIFKRVLSIAQINKNRGIAEEDAVPRREIKSEEIVRIHTPTFEERWRALVDRAAESSKCRRYQIAIREASLALDLSRQHPLPFFIRAFSNHRLGYHADAEADASACLKLEPGNTGALSIRAYSSLALGESRLARDDAEAILMSDPDDRDGLYILAEASLRLGEYETAIDSAEDLLGVHPDDEEAVRIIAEAREKLEED